MIDSKGRRWRERWRLDYVNLNPYDVIIKLIVLSCCNGVFPLAILSYRILRCSKYSYFSCFVYFAKLMFHFMPAFQIHFSSYRSTRRQLEIAHIIHSQLKVHLNSPCMLASENLGFWNITKLSENSNTSKIGLHSRCVWRRANHTPPRALAHTNPPHPDEALSHAHA